MIHLARTSRAVLAVTVALVAACGGKGGKDTTTKPGGPPFDQAAVKAAIGAVEVSDTQSCDAAGAVTVADAMGTMRSMLESDGGAVDESFTCRASSLTDGRWECTWEVWSRPAGGGDPCGSDPCEGGGSGYQAIAQVNADGSLVPGQLACIAPG